MPLARRAIASTALLIALALTLTACAPGGERKSVPLGPAERFDWVAQPVEFSPPPGEWRREGDNGGGLLGVRFILANGGGQVMSVAAYARWAEKLPRREIERLLGELETLDERNLLRKLGRLRVQVTDPLTSDEERAAHGVNQAVDRAQGDVLAGRRSFVRSDIEEALLAVAAFKPTLDELLPHMRLRPETRQNPEWWVLGPGTDTTISGRAAHVSDDTLVLPEQRLLYRQVFWVVDGTAFQAIYQGRPEHQHVFEQMVESVRFPARGTNAPN
jgi:hypothetical protein